MTQTKFIVAVLIILAMINVSSRASHANPTAEEMKKLHGEVVSLIPKLDSDDFSTRVAACEELSKVGEPLLAILADIRRNPGDLENTLKQVEVKSQLGKISASIIDQMGVPRDTDTAKPEHAQKMAQLVNSPDQRFQLFDDSSREEMLRKFHFYIATKVLGFNKAGEPWQARDVEIVEVEGRDGKLKGFTVTVSTKFAGKDETQITFTVVGTAPATGSSYQVLLVDVEENLKRIPKEPELPASATLLMSTVCSCMVGLMRRRCNAVATSKVITLHS